MELTYTKHGDYYLPDLDIPAKEKVSVNRYGRMHGNYLRKNKDDLDDRLYRMYDKIDDLEQSLIEARAKKQSIEAEKMTGDIEINVE